MFARLLCCLVIVTLTACEAPPPPTTAAPSLAAIENPGLSARSLKSEDADRTCAADARALDAALRTRSGTDTLATAFDRVARCREGVAGSIIAGPRSTRADQARAAALLIGLRGALRRDVARLNGALFNRPDGQALRAQISSARERMDALVLQGG